MRWVEHKFRPGETIDAVIRHLARQHVTHAQLRPLRAAFNELNENRLPHPGDVFKIPLPDVEQGS